MNELLKANYFLFDKHLEHTIVANVMQITFNTMQIQFSVLTHLKRKILSQQRLYWALHSSKSTMEIDFRLKVYIICINHIISQLFDCKLNRNF